MIRDFSSYKPTVDELARLELSRLRPNEKGFRLDITSPGIRDALREYRVNSGIAVGDPLSDDERAAFEYWYISQEIAKTLSC